MKTIAILFVLVCSAVAQNSTIQTQTFSFNAAPISLGYDGTFVGTDVGLSFSPTQNFSLFETNMLSSDAHFHFYAGGIGYQIPYLSKWINDRTPKVSGFRLLFGLRGALGQAETAAGNHVGALIQGTVNYSFDSGGHYQMGAQVGAARFPGFSKGWTSVVELGPSLHF